METFSRAPPKLIINKIGSICNFFLLVLLNHYSKHMVLFKRAYTTIISALAFREIIDSRLSVAKDNRSRMAAEKIIRQSPTTAEGYLVLGSLHMQQNNYDAALSVYNQGLCRVRPSDARYSQLERQQHYILALRAERNQKFQRLLPYDVLCLVFENLDIGDLLQCASVSQAWCNMVLDWPRFWRRLSVEMPGMKRSLITSLIRGQTPELVLDSSMNDGLVRDTLKVLSLLGNQLTEKLSFKDITFANEDIGLLAGAIRSTKRVEFVDCSIPKLQVFRLILESCSKVSQVSFSQIRPARRTLEVPEPSRRQMVIPNLHYSELTYLKLCFEYSFFDREPVPTGRLSGLLRRCPNLVHLFLDARGTVHHGHCIRQALKYCPRLETLVVHDRAEMPQSPLSGRALNITTTRNTGRLRRLVLSGDYIKCQPRDIDAILKRASGSVEFLYAHFGNGLIGPNELYKFDGLRLREIHLSTEGGAVKNDKNISITAALATLFSRCLALEAITLIDTFSTGYNPSDGHIYVDDQVLSVVATNCPKLQYMRVIARRHHTDEGILNFATTGGSNLIFLEMDIEPKNILEVVQKLGRLRDLRTQKDLYSYNPSISSADRESAKRILEDRGGSLLP
ncbi:hypothetical protein BJV82DRAFT_630089 [Fennellomyces sp. T-0311]|nr:hypothetical protein BJV82DRAFT_630089 [Fennellomyces sp. T-0311]